MRNGSMVQIPPLARSCVTKQVTLSSQFNTGPSQENMTEKLLAGM